MARLSRRRVRGLVTGAAIGGALAIGVPIALAINAPGGVSSNPTSPDNQQSAWTFSWNAVAPDAGNILLRYEGGLTSSPTGTPTTSFGTSLSTNIAPSEGAQFFRVRAVQQLIASPFTITTGPYSTLPITADFTNPSVSSWTLSPAAPNGTNGWYTSNVTITPNCSDALSGVASCTGGGTKTGNGAGQNYTNGAATDNAGNSVSGQVSPSVSIDKQDPTDPNLTAPPDNTDTNDNTPTFTWTNGTDAVSGMSHHVVQRQLNGSGAFVTISPNIAHPTTSWTAGAQPDGNHDYRVQAVDIAGNVENDPAEHDIFIDTVNPQINSWSLNPAAPNGLNGWYTSNVSVSPNCSDPSPSSGIDTCTGGGTHSNDGASQSFSNGATSDDAGNSISGATSPAVNVDKSDPDDAALQTPSPNAVTNDTTPTLVWDPTADNGPSGLDHYEVTLDGNTTNVPAGTESFTPAAPLANGGHTWKVDTVDVAGNKEEGDQRSFTVDPNAVGGPTITGGPSNPTNQTSHTFTWSGAPGATEYKWELRKGSTVIDNGTQGGGSTSATVNSAGDGTYTFVITQKTTGVHGSETSYVFRVDTVAPAQPVLVNLPPDSSTNASPTFSWVGEPLGLYRWQVLSGSTIVQQGDSLANQITTSPLAPGTYIFRVRQTDDAGNVGPFSPQDGFSVVAPTPQTPAAPPAPTPTTTTKTTTKTTTASTPAVANTRRLKPRVGTKVTTKRPTLRWNRRAGATVYNIQIFELNGRNFKKVLSRFPVRNTFRVPAGKLKYGKRYVWRVWPFLGTARAAASNPVGVSYFDVRRPKLSAVLAKRLLTPRAARFAKAKKITARWKNRRGSRFYRVELRRGKKIVYRSTTRRRRVVIPAKRLRGKGTYTLVVRASRGTARNKFHRVTWARGTFRRT